MGKCTDYESKQTQENLCVLRHAHGFFSSLLLWLLMHKATFIRLMQKNKMQANTQIYERGCRHRFFSRHAHCERYL